MSCGIHLNDIGTIVKVQINDCNGVAIDVSTASSKSIVFKKPGGTSVTKSASFVTDGTDGLISYTIQSGDIDEIGTWKLQAIVVVGSFTWHSSFESFKVHRNI